LFTPRGTPRVLYEEEFSAVLLTPADNYDSVIDGSSTLSSVVEDTTRVGLEVLGRSSDRNGGWLLLNGILEISSILACNISVSSGTNQA
jgi:hypothetical protein